MTRDPRPILPRPLRRARNRLLRRPIVTTRDLGRAARSRWTWGSDGPQATTARITGLSILHDLGAIVGLEVYLWLAHRAPAGDPRWDGAVLTARRVWQ